MQLPHVRHVVTHLWCGYREAIRPGNAYPERCPNDGHLLEHADVAIDDRAELAAIARDGQDSRRPTHTFSIRR